MLVIGWILTVFVGVLAAVLLYLMVTRKIDLKSLISDENGDASIARFQFLVFTFVIAMSLFYLTASKTPVGYPEIPNQILALLGISGGSYVVAKGLEKGKLPSFLTGGLGKKENVPIVIATFILLVLGISGIIWVFVAAFHNARIAAGKPLPATVSSCYGSCCVRTLFNKNQVSVYFGECELKVRDDITFRRGQFVSLTIDEANVTYNRPIKAADATRGFFLDVTVNEPPCK